MCSLYNLLFPFKRSRVCILFDPKTIFNLEKNKQKRDKDSHMDHFPNSKVKKNSRNLWRNDTMNILQITKTAVIVPLKYNIL